MKLVLSQMLNDIDSLPLSIDTFKKIANCKHALKFSDLKEYNSLEQLFGVFGNKILILMLQTPSFAHYCCLFRKDRNNAVWYESYGYDVDYLISLSPETILHTNSVNFLQELENNSSMKIDYNSFQHQKQNMPKNNITTCAFHCANRLRFSTLSNEEYNEYMKSTNMDLDFFVILTNLNTYLDNVQ